MKRIKEPKNNPSEVVDFLRRLKLNNDNATAAQCLQIVDFYQREFGYFNVKWPVGEQLVYMYEKLKNKYDNELSFQNNRQPSIQETQMAYGIESA